MAPRRKKGHRYPCGKLKPEFRKHEIPPAAVGRLVRATEMRLIDPNMGTWIGSFRLTGKLNNIQFSSALRWATLIGQNDRARNFPRRSVKSPSYQVGFGGNGADPLDQDPQARASTILAYDEAARGLGPRRTLVSDICLDERTPAYWEIKELINGLDFLAIYFGMEV